MTQDISNRMQEAAPESELGVSYEIKVRGLCPPGPDGEIPIWQTGAKVLEKVLVIFFNTRGLQNDVTRWEIGLYTKDIRRLFHFSVQRAM